MTMTFTCDLFAEHLAAHLEGDADATTRAAMDAHAAGCQECSALLTDLVAIQRDAADLPELVPGRDLWAGISERIGTPVISLTASGAGGRGSGATTNDSKSAANPQGRRWWAHPALAAAALVGITAGVTYYATREAIGPGATGPISARAVAVTDSVSRTLAAPVDVAVGGSSTPAEVDQVDSSAGSVRVAVAPDPRPAAPVAVHASYRPGDLAALDSLYYREIIRLRRVLDSQRGQLDSTTVQVLDRNMLVIDRAIQECRAALAADPASRFLNEQLNDALETKIELLRTAAVMSAGA